VFALSITVVEFLQALLLVKEALISLSALFRRSVPLNSWQAAILALRCW
jgi:hydrogenase-4 membrane subunit HyfE